MIAILALSGDTTWTSAGFVPLRIEARKYSREPYTRPVTRSLGSGQWTPSVATGPSGAAPISVVIAGIALGATVAAVLAAG